MHTYIVCRLEHAHVLLALSPPAASSAPTLSSAPHPTGDSTHTYQGQQQQEQQGQEGHWAALLLTPQALVGAAGGGGQGQEEEEEGEWCDEPGCGRRYRHEHVGRGLGTLLD